MSFVRNASAFLIVLFGCALSGCSNARSGQPEVRAFYMDAAKREARNPVIVIHGILGARLVERATNKVVWGAFTSDAIDPDTPEGARAFAVPVPPPEGAGAYDPDTAAVYPTGPVEAIDVDLLFGIVSVDVYAQILSTLGVGGYTDAVYAGPEYADDHFTCHTFFYDWRRDNVENAMALGRYIAKTRERINQSATRSIANLRAKGTTESIAAAEELEAWLKEGYRFDIVAHSMGGLVARYYLRYGMEDIPRDGTPPPVTWAGSEEVDRLILVGTPSLGAMESLEQLLNGYDLGILLPSYHQGLLGTMPAIYQLLPRNQNLCIIDEAGTPIDIDLFDADTWDRNGWGIMDPDSDRILQWLLEDTPSKADRRARAKAYLAASLSRAKAFHAALDQIPTKPCPTDIRLFAGDTVSTLARAIGHPQTNGQLRLNFTGPNTRVPGDGTVARYSAVGDTRTGHGSSRNYLPSPIPWTNVTFLPDDHLGLTSNPYFTNNLLFYLLQQAPRRRAHSRN